MTELFDSAIRRGREALARGDLTVAYQSAQSALRADPRDARVHALLGVVLSEANDLSSGEWHLRRGLDLAPAHVECCVNLAINLTRQGRTDEAELLFARADALSPGKLEVLAQWSRLREFQGDLRQAEELLERAAAASSPRDVELLRVIYLARGGRHQEALAILEAATELGGEAQLERGRLYDRLGRHTEAWRDWVQAKAKLATQAGSEYQSRAVETFGARLKQFFVRASVELLPRAGVRGDVAQPIFIMGFPRSGTTLIERILSNHSAVRPGGELTFVGEWPRLIERLCAGAGAFPENLAQTWSADHRHVADLLRDYYLSRAQARGLLEPGKRFFTDKMPFNEMWLPLIRMAFPDAKIVRVIRHPLDVCVSMLSYDLTHGFNCGYRIDTIVHQLCSMLDLRQHYERELELNEITVKYEDLVRHPAEQIRRLLDYIGLPFEPDCLTFRENRRYAATPSYAQVTEGLNERSVCRYRCYLEQFGPCLPQLAPRVAAMGYDI